MADKTSTARGASIAFLLNLFGKIALLSARLIASRLLGPAAYGVVALGMSTTEIIAFTGTAGLDQATLRLSGDDRLERDHRQLMSDGDCLTSGNHATIPLQLGS